MNKDSLFVKTNKFCQKVFNKKIVLLPTENTDIEEGIVLNEACEDTWKFLNKPRKLYEIAGYIKGIYKTDKAANVEKDIMEFIEFLEKMEYISIIDDVKLANINREHCIPLSEISNTDVKLKKAIEDDLTKSPDEFYNEILKWQTDTNTNVFTIIFDSKPIGIISLCNMNVSYKTSRVYLWISSRYWNMGICTRAFKKIIDIAKDNDINLLKCRIAKNNKYLLKIWKKYKSDIKIVGKNYEIELSI